MDSVLIVGNWKMNTSLKEGRELAREIDRTLVGIKMRVVLCPPFTHLQAIRAQISYALLGAQDTFWQVEGEYTGEISPAVLKEMGCQYVILGHSERRKHLLESDGMVNKKVKASLNQNLRPILCIGESEEERDRGQTFKVIQEQLDLDLKDIDNINYLIIAYEPIWAIGSGDIPDPSDTNNTARFIRKVIKKKYGGETADNTTILYGGSVTSSNVEGFVSQKNIGGVLVGGASIKAEEFIKIIKASSQS